MAFNIPIPEDRSGEMIGQGLANAMMLYQRGRELRQSRAEHDTDRAHMLQAQTLDDAIRQSSARQAGITPGTAPHEDLDLTVPDGMPASTDHLPFDEAMRPNPQGLAGALKSQFDAAGSGAMRAPSSAPSTPGAFSIAGGGFHSPLKDAMGGGGVQQAGAPAGGGGAPPISRQPMGGGGPGVSPGGGPGVGDAAPSHTLHMQGNYQQLTPDYYLDRSAPGPRGAALAAELGRQKTEAEIGELGARAKYYQEHGDYFEQGGYRGGASGNTRMDQLHNRVTELVTKGMPLADADRQARAEFGYQQPRPSTAAPLAVRGARQSATSSRQDAGAFDRLANAFEKPINDPTTKLVGDTTDFPARRDSVSKYRGKADSARAAASGYDQQANAGSGVAPPVLNRQPSAPSAGAPAAAGRYSRQQIDSLYQDAVKRGADPAQAKARRDQLMKTAAP